MHSCNTPGHIRLLASCQRMPLLVRYEQQGQGLHPEDLVEHLNSTMSSHFTYKMKMHFACYGIPDVVMSDNGPQFASEEYKQFSKVWISHPHPTILEAMEKRQPRVWWWRQRKTAQKFTWCCSTIGTLLLKAWTQVLYKGSWVATLRPTMARLLQPQSPDRQHKKMLSNQE